MSLCLLIQRENEVYMAGDSRVSIKINEKSYRWNDNYSKIEQVENFIIFKSGTAEVMNNVVDLFKKSDVKTISVFRDISRNEYEKYVKREGSNFKPYSVSKRFTCAGLVCTIKNDKPAVYFISDGLDFLIQEMGIPENKDVNEIFLGVRIDESTAAFKTCTFDYNDFNNVFDNYRKVYESVVDTDIGGNLTVLKISKDGIISKSCGLKNPKHIEEFSDYLLETYFKKVGNNCYNIGTSLLTAEDFKNSRGESMFTINKQKISVDYIETERLVVGQNVQMGANATISWSQITNQPTIIDSNTVTQISRNEIQTATIRANQLVIGGANGSISFSDLSNKPFIPASAADVGALPIGTFIPNDNYITTITANYIVTPNLITNIGQVADTLQLGSVNTPGTLVFQGGANVLSESNPQGPILKYTADQHIFYGDRVWFSGVNSIHFNNKQVDFTGATVTGLSVTPKFA